MATLQKRGVTSNWSTNAPVVLTKVPGTQAGDLLIAAVGTHGGSLTAPAGWSLVRGNSNLNVFAKIATAAEPASYTFSNTSTWVARLTGYYGGTALSLSAIETVVTKSGLGNAPKSGTVRNTSATDLVVWCAALDGTWTLTPPSDFTGGSLHSNSGNGVTMGSYQKAPGSAGTGTYAGSISTATAWWTTTLVLTPATAPHAPSLLSPSTGSYQQVSTGVNFQSRYNATDGANANAYCLQIKKTTASSWSYWNASSGLLQSTAVWNSCAVAPNGTLSVTLGIGVLNDGAHYSWSVAMQEGFENLRGPFATPNLFWAADSGPALSVQGPTGIEPTSRVIVAWTATPTTTLRLTKYRVQIFTTAQRSVGGFTPGTSTSTYDSGTLTGTTFKLAVPTTLANQTKYFAYVQVKETGTIASAWAYVTFTIIFDAPAKPTITALSTTTPTTGYPCVKLTVQGHTNLLSAVDASFETGIGTWVTTATKATLAQAKPPVTPPDGSYALQLTPKTAESLIITHIATNAVEVTPGAVYAVMVEVLAAATSRTAILNVAWRKATGTFISTITVASHADSTSTWTKLSGIVTAPATAHDITVSVAFSALSGVTDVHYIDCVGVFPSTMDYDAYVSSLTPRAWWKLADATGSTTAADSSGNGFTGTVASGSVTFGKAGPIEAIPLDTAALFASGEITTTLKPTGTAITCLAWYRSTATSGIQIIMDSGGIAQDGITLYLASGKLTLESTFSSIADASSTADDEWHFGAVTYNGTTVSLYRDGELIGNIAGSGNVGAAWGLHIGYLGTDYFSGTLAQLAVFEAPLTAAEISTLYSFSTAPTLPVTTWSAGGFVGNTKLMVVRSTVTEGTTPYTPTPMYVRGASTANKAVIPTDQKLTLYDRETFPGIQYRYTGIVVSGNQHSGTGFTSVTVKVTPTEWWEIDPTTPTSAVAAQPTAWNPQQLEQSTATQVTGQVHMTVIANVMMRQDFQGTFEIFTGPLYRALQKILTSQKTVFVLSPFSDLDSGYFRIGPEPGGLSTGSGNKTKTAQLLPSTAAAPHRTLTVTAVAQARPQV